MEDIETLRAAQAAANGSNEEVFDDEVAAPPKGGKTAHHIRANSSIMHLNKILGESRARPVAKIEFNSCARLLTFVFITVANRGEIRKYYAQSHMLVFGMVR
jgi:hypothetical protein